MKTVHGKLKIDVNRNSQYKEKHKIIAMSILLIICVFLTYYFHAILGIDTVFTHFFYVPIILAPFWWKRKGLFVAIFLAVMLIISHVFLIENVPPINDYPRLLMFIAISSVVAMLSERVGKAEITLEKQREELSEFAHTTAHDIKNPLMVIKGYAELLKEADETGMSTKIIKQIDELDEFIRRNLVLADAGKVNGYVQEVNLNVLIGGIAKNTFPENIDFMADKLPIIKCDPERWKQVFQNLFINAIEHGKPSKVWVKHEQKGNWNVIKINDNGAGIPPREIEKVFDRGYTTSPSNSGLGLAIVEKIVKSQSGKIKVESKEEKGTIFTIMLPIDV